MSVLLKKEKTRKASAALSEREDPPWSEIRTLFIVMIKIQLKLRQIYQLLLLLLFLLNYEEDTDTDG